MSRHQRLGKTMNSEQRRARRLRNGAMRQWKRAREVHEEEWAVRAGVPAGEADVRRRANAAARARFGWSPRTMLLWKRGS